MTVVKEWTFGKRHNQAVMWEVAQPKAVLQLVHGMVEHIKRYDEFARFLNQAGYVVVGHDHVGHGDTVASPEEYGVFPDDWQALVEDVHALKKEVSTRYPNIPYFIMGHSMGSYITRLYLAEYGEQLDGAIVMGTGQEPLLKTLLARGLVQGLTWLYGPLHRSQLVESLSTGAFNKQFAPNQTSVDWLTRDEQEREKYLQHPHHQFRPTLSMYRSLFTFAHYAAKETWIKRIPKELPLLIISGEKDPVGNAGKGVQRFYKQLKKQGHDLVTIILYPEARHELLNEYNKEEVMKDLLDWLDSVTLH